jgi:hypothetical protein
MGYWIQQSWSVQRYGLPEVDFDKLADAKAFAVDNGASGKWIRGEEFTGPRGRQRTTYTDAKGGA